MPERAMPERAEIEAVARAIYPHYSEFDGRHKAHAADVIAALDRVRDARDDDETGIGAVERDVATLRQWDSNPAAHEALDRLERVALARRGCEFCGLPFPKHTDECDVWKGTPVDPALDARDAARSPQGEDREAEAVAALYEFARERWGWGSEEYESVRDAVAVVLARVSPSRDGTVAVEDYIAQKEATMKLRSLGDEMARAILDLRMHEGRSAWDAAEIARDRWLAEFSRPVQPEPDALGGVPPSQPKEDKR